jgi:hypothetical protein
MLTETQDTEEIIQRVAALDIGKPSWSAVSGCRTPTGRASGCRR